MQNVSSKECELSQLKANEYRLSFKRMKRVCSRFTLSLVSLLLILGTALITTKYFRFFWPEIPLGIFNIFLLVFLFKKLKEEKRFFLFDRFQLDKPALLFLENEIVRYYKRLAIINYFTAPVLILTLYYTLPFIFPREQAAKEVSYQIVLLYCCAIVVFVYLMLSTCLTLYCGRPFLSKAQIKQSRIKLAKINLASIFYWLAVCGVLFFASSTKGSDRICCIIFMAVYLTVMVIVNLSSNKYSYYSPSKRAVAFCSLGLAFLLVISLMHLKHDYLAPSVSSVSRVDYIPDKIEYNEKDGTFVITTEKQGYKILQLSDIHLGGSLISKSTDLKALSACRKIISDAKPDLVVVTGDLVFSIGLKTLSFDNYTPVSSFCDFMENIGIPWVFTYGNHDTEFISLASASEIDELYISRSYINGGLLLYPDIKPEVYGRCNQCVEIRNTNGKLRQALFFLDSNADVGLGINAYTGIHQDQVDWYESKIDSFTKKEGALPSSIVFTHIPPHETELAYDLYKADSDLVEFFEGVVPDNRFGNFMACQPESSKLFDAVLEKGSTKAVFYGHDHFVTLDMKYKGVRLSYGLSIDYITRGKMVKNTYQRGGTVIELFADSSYSTTRRLLSDIK